MSSTVSPALTLEEFLSLPETEPAGEFIDGEVVQKVSPRAKHSRLQKRLCNRLDGALLPRYEAFPELRCTFGGRSLVPDVAVLAAKRIPRDGDGEVANDVWVAPDLVVEILSPEQSPADLEEKMRFYVAHGVALGWLVDPHSRQVRVYRPGAVPEVLGLDGVLEDAGLPGFRLPVAEMFGWLKLP